MAEGRVRLGIVDALERDGFEVCAELEDTTAAVAAAREQHPDLALLHSRRPGAGIVAARDIVRSGTHVSVVLLDDVNDDQRLFAALEAGVSGVLQPDIDPERLPRIVRGVLAGEAAMSRATMSRVLREFTARSMRGDPVTAGTPRLSPRQQEVLTQLALGKSTSEIATALYISRGTVRTHVFTILRRLQLPDRAAAVAYVLGLDSER